MVVHAAVALTVMLRLPLAVLAGTAESVTVTVKLKGLPVAVVGVPLIAPEELRLKPGGKVPPVWAQVYGGIPPDAFSWVFGYAVLTVPVGKLLDVVVTVSVATVMVMLKFADAFCCGLVESVTMTVTLKGLPVLVDGVPEMTPVLELMLSPGGREEPP